MGHGRLRRETAAAAWTTTRATLSVVRAHPRLLAFPAVALLATAAGFPFLLVGTVRGIEVATAALGSLLGWYALALVPVLLYVGVGVLVAGLTAGVTFCNLGVVHATHRLIRGDPPSVLRGFAAAARATPHVLAYAALVGSVGALAALARRRSASTRRDRRRTFARVTGQPYSALTYLLGPAVVVDGASPAGMFRRSATVLTERFGEDPVVSMGVLQGVATVGAIPFVASQVALVGHALATGGAVPAWTENLPVLGGIVGTLWVGIVLGSALAAVAKTALYVAIEADRERAPLVDRRVADLVDVVDDE